MLSYEGESFKGVADIMNKLKGMPMMNLKIDSFDAQPSASNGIAVLVNGQLLIEGSDNALKFA